MKLEVRMSKETAEELRDREKFEKLTRGEKEIWLFGYEFAIKRIKKASWFQRLFKLFC